MCGTHSSLPIEKETAMEEKESKQALYLVMGGRVTDPRNVTFSDPESIHVAGVFSSYENAVEAWRSNAQRSGNRDEDLTTDVRSLGKIRSSFQLFPQREWERWGEG